MSDDATPDLALIARQNRQLLTALQNLRNDLAIMTSTISMQESSMRSLWDELRGMHDDQRRFTREPVKRQHLLEDQSTSIVVRLNTLDARVDEIEKRLDGREYPNTFGT
jgi:hypothetical protein